VSMFETTANQARQEGWGDYDPDVVTCVDCGALLDDNELILGAFCRECQPGVEYPPVGVRRRYRQLCGSGR
jgi:hypothetical protein